jgi:hypothetical protein
VCPQFSYFAHPGPSKWHILWRLFLFTAGQVRVQIKEQKQEEAQQKYNSATLAPSA